MGKIVLHVFSVSSADQGWIFGFADYSVLIGRFTNYCYWQNLAQTVAVSYAAFTSDAEWYITKNSKAESSRTTGGRTGDVGESHSMSIGHKKLPLFLLPNGCIESQTKYF